MPRIIRDFIKSGKSKQDAGFFANDEVAMKISRTIGKNQIRRFERYGHVPDGFFRYLKERGIIPEWTDTSMKAVGRGVSDLLDFLWNCPHRSQKSRDAAEFIRKLVLVSMHPELKKVFGNGESLWSKLENSRRPKKRKSA